MLVSLHHAMTFNYDIDQESFQCKRKGEISYGVLTSG